MHRIVNKEISLVLFVINFKTEIIKCTTFEFPRNLLPCFYQSAAFATCLMYAKRERAVKQDIIFNKRIFVLCEMAYMNETLHGI